MKKVREKTLKQEKGITLVALMITIIVLLILAGVTLSLTLGERGIFKTAKGARQNYMNAQAEEQTGLDNFDREIANVIGGGSNARWITKATARGITRKWTNSGKWNTGKKAK